MATVMFTNTHPKTGNFSPLTRMIARVAYALQIRKERKALAELTNAQLEDIGVTPAQAQREAQKPVWDVPSHWVC